MAVAGYQDLRSQFRWRVPQVFNIGTACADAQDPDAPALIDTTSKTVVTHTFGDLRDASNRLANGLTAVGVKAGDRVGIILPQSFEAAVAHLAVYKLGAVVLPLSTLFGPDALSFRLEDSEARAVITVPPMVERVLDCVTALDATLILVEDENTAVPAGAHRFDDLVEHGSPLYSPAVTGPDSPALLIYTSGTTGGPKGALHGHRVLLGHLPGFELAYDFFPQDGDRIWTPADWAWIGGLINVVLPAWYHGRPVVAATRRGFDPQWACDVINGNGVTTAFLPPTALKMMRQGLDQPVSLGLRAVMSGGESLGDEMLRWSTEFLGVSVNEIFGQTEANLVIGSCAAAWEARPGSMGLAYPGHDVVILDHAGDPATRGTLGEIAVRAPDPVMFLEYWRRPDATAAKYRGEWLLTGDLGWCDDDGYLWFSSRADDLINSAGYRIGPAEIEATLIKHPAVSMAAVVGVPDDIRGEVVKAFVQLLAGHVPSEALAADIQTFVASRLAAYQYPRSIEFVEDLPLTTTGKIRRRALRAAHDTRSTR